MFNFSIIKIFEKEGIPYGVLLQIDNGDTQYLPIEEFNKFKALVAEQVDAQDLKSCNLKGCTGSIPVWGTIGKFKLKQQNYE